MCFRANCCSERDREETGGNEGKEGGQGREGSREGRGREGRKQAASLFRRCFCEQEFLRLETLDFLIHSCLDPKWSRTSFAKFF